MTTRQINTRYGRLTVSLTTDVAGNYRLVPDSHGTLEEWRANPTTVIPPWILACDCDSSAEFAEVIGALIDLDRAHAVADHSRDLAAGGVW
jgi:hypothetical protein